MEQTLSHSQVCMHTHTYARMLLNAGLQMWKPQVYRARIWENQIYVTKFKMRNQRGERQEEWVRLSVTESPGFNWIIFNQIKFNHIAICILPLFKVNTFLHGMQI